MLQTSIAFCSAASLITLLLLMSMHEAFRQRRWWPWLLLLLVIVGLVWGLVGAMQARRQAQAMLAQQSSQAPTVLKVPADHWLALHSKDLVLGVAVRGALHARDTATVKARVSGELQALQVREGDTVRKGQILAKVDATEAQARYRQAQLQADAAQAQVAIQQRQFDNNQALVGRGFISATALETAAANLRAAQANHAAARAAQDASRKTLDDTVLHSPIDGQVSQRMANVGERVNVDAPIMEIVDVRHLELEVPLTPNDSWHVQVGQAAQLLVEGSGAPPLQARVVRINPAAQAGSRTVPAYLQVSQTTQTAGPLLRPGMFVTGHIVTGAAQGLAVPLDAVYTDQPEPYVQTVKDGRVVHSSVHLGWRSVPAVAQESSAVPWVIVDGLPAQTPVLLAGVGRLPEGTAVQLQPAQQQEVTPALVTSPQPVADADKVPAVPAAQR